MKRLTIQISLILCILLAISFSANAQQAHNYLQYVNPFIGTAKSNVITRWGSAGGIYPGAVASSGFIHLSPETSLKGARGYNYTDSVIYYFTCFGHMSGFPEGSAGQLGIMPVAANADIASGNYRRKFSHEKETASPGYYKVIFDGGTTVEATTTPRTGIFQITFNNQVAPRLFVADAGEMVTPYNQELHVGSRNAVILFSEPYQAKKRVKGGWLFSFSKSSSAKILNVRLSTSSIDHAAAKQNINKEQGRAGFDEIRKQAVLAWQKKLSVIDVADDNVQGKTVFYTALYHSLLVPWVIDDADGRYLGGDGKIHQRSGHDQYGAFSPWDTFRTLHPLLTLLYPDKQKDVILSMLDVYRQNGHLPIESMTGNHAIPIIVDSYLKGIQGFDKAEAYEAMKKSLVTGPFLQKDMEAYHQNGYVPFTYAESVTRTVEYAYDDWALAQFAKNVIADSSTWNLELGRGYNYRNLFNKDAVTFLPKNGNVFKLQPGMSGYKEGDQWVYGYFVPQNVKDLVNLSGGDKLFAERLDSVLQNQVIVFDNETVFQVPYLFNQAGRPDLTQKWCRQIMLGRFTNSPGGLPGNDDLGSTSSWYIFSAMGFYPTCPGKPLYSIGTPLFKTVTLNLLNDRKLTISSDQQGGYVGSVSINGKPWQQLTIPHTLLSNGGSIAFEMSSELSQWLNDKDPAALSETQKPADIQISNISVSANKVAPGQLFYMRYKLTNNGSTGLQKVIVFRDVKPYAYKNALVEQGQTIQDSIGLQLYAAKNTTLSMEGFKPVNVKVISTNLKPENALRITGIKTMPMVSLQEQGKLSYTIQNVDGRARTFYVPISLDNKLIFTDTILLDAGEKRDVQHKLVSSGSGFHQVAVNGLQIRYKVYQQPAEALLLSLSPGGVKVTDMIPDSSGFGSNGHIILANKNSSGHFVFNEDNYVEVPNAASLDEMGETLTMMGWVYPTGNEKGLVDIITKGDSHVLQVTDQKTLTFFAGGWGRGDCTVNLPADWRDNWHHIAGVCSGKKLELYIDGILSGTAETEESADLSNTSKWVLGRNEEFPGERIFHGQMDKVKIYKTPLTAAEISNIYKQERRK
ncbi:GH92 family glycosyl hydrolase [Mucilaginibacter sp. UR6-1]|uniref:GH92 family glycosyl hydrolase n=1 Tax=Mucilaginibacter sp. UR6-1 TaxID=1435643 RepID=UPI001E5EF6E5|nr:GH92 family glycosyl hydrolase [Mucilaginibacter sp. UR6-1]MCC8408207.1 GH92 family glycosyl hydrolase [Mucilaginibacter sp. UR6-1]